MDSNIQAQLCSAHGNTWRTRGVAYTHAHTSDAYKAVWKWKYNGNGRKFDGNGWPQTAIINNSRKDQMLSSSRRTRKLEYQHNIGETTVDRCPLLLSIDNSLFANSTLPLVHLPWVRNGRTRSRRIIVTQCCFLFMAKGFLHSSLLWWHFKACCFDTPT